jgi:hypothetical protein
MALFNDNTEIISTDGVNNKLNICDINGNLINTFNPNGLLHHPMSICINDCDLKNIEIYIGDYVLHKIIIFDVNFKYKREFGNDTLKVPEFIEIDKDNFDNLAYISDYRSNNITIWNSEKCFLTETIQIDSPFSLKIFDKKIFVVSPAQFELWENEVFKKITKGSNCIFILDKISLKIISTIKLDDWITPSALYIDLNMNIYTVAYELDKVTGHLSQFKYFYVINKNGVLIRKIFLDDIQVIADMIVLENELLFSVNNEIKMIQFK